MSDATKKGEGAGQTCGVTLDEHIDSLTAAMAVFHLGGGCEDTYRSLLEVAEGLRQYFKYSEYVPSGKKVLAILDEGDNPNRPVMVPGPATPQ